MSVYWITFRLEQNTTYDDRYKALIDTVDKMKSMWWGETSSFILFEAEKTIDEVAAAIKKAINASTDIVLIGMSDYKSARVIGPIKDQDLFKLMPFTKKA